MGKKVLITGANGYIGARLSKYLSEKGNLITGVCYPVIPDNREWKKNFTNLYQGDLRDKKFINKITNQEFDTVIHLVSLDHHQSNGDPWFVNSVNVNPTWSLLKGYEEKSTLNKFIYFSTIQVYGKLPNEIITESQMLAPKNIYGLTHLLSEQICDYYNRNSEIDCINVRLSNSYGSPVFQDNNCWWLVVNDLCKNAFYDEKILIKSDGSPQRDFIHGNDVSEGIVRLLEKEKKYTDENVYHISKGETKSILELAFEVKKAFKIKYGQSIPVYAQNELISGNYDFSPAKKNTIDNSKIRELGFYPKISLLEGIFEILDYLEKQNNKK